MQWSVKSKFHMKITWKTLYVLTVSDGTQNTGKSDFPRIYFLASWKFLSRTLKGLLFLKMVSLQSLLMLTRPTYSTIPISIFFQRTLLNLSQKASKLTIFYSILVRPLIRSTISSSYTNCRCTAYKVKLSSGSSLSWLEEARQFFKKVSV